MTTTSKLAHAQTVCLKLTADERQLLDSVIQLDGGLDEELRLAVIGAEEVSLSLEQLEHLAGCIAAVANHTKDWKLQQKLDLIGDKVDGLLGIPEED